MVTEQLKVCLKEKRQRGLFNKNKIIEKYRRKIQIKPK